MTRTEAELENPWAAYGWMLSAMWLVFLVYPLIGAVNSDRSLALKLLGTLAMAAFGAVYVWAMTQNYTAEGKPVGLRTSVGWFTVLLALLLASTPVIGLETDLEVVAQVGRGDEVLAAVRTTSPDVCLLDIETPGLDGIAVAELLARERPGVRSLVVTTFGRLGYVRRALEAGASGFIVKDAPAAELAAAIRRVHQGLRVVDPALAAESLFGGSSPLTSRERDVLRLAIEGHRSPEIARRIHLSAATVRNHLSSAIAKTGTATAVEAAREAQRRGWL